LLIVVLGTMISVVNGHLNPAVLGKVEGFGVASGLLGVMWLLYLLISRTFGKGSENSRSTNLGEKR